MDPITLDQLRVFLAIVETGSFSGAARRLHRAQSAISYAMTNLERLLELSLFDRSTRTPTLTAHGHALLADARAVAAQVGQLEAHARALVGGLEPRIAIAVDAMFPLDVMLSALTAFRTRYPLVQIGFYTEVLGGVVEHLIDDTCQIGICAEILTAQPGLVRNHIADVELVYVISPSHPLAQLGRPASSADLQHHIQLVMTDRSEYTAGRDFGVLSGSTWRLADLETKLECLRAGLGWGSMPRHRIAGDLERGTLVPLAIHGQDTSLRASMFLLRRETYEPGPCARWLIARLTADSERMRRPPLG